MRKTVLNTLKGRYRIDKILRNSSRSLGMGLVVYCLLILQSCTSSEGKLTEARALMQQGKFREAIQP